MNPIFKTKRLIARFAADRSGNFALLMGVTIWMLAVVVGFGINISQLYNAKTTLVQSLDAALTSTGRDITLGLIRPGDADAAALRFLLANGDGGVAEGKRMTLDPLKIDTVAKTIHATAHVDVDAFFPLFGQANKTRITTTAATLYSDTMVEVGLMLDVTGSMSEKGTPLDGKSQNKLDNLKAAATGAVTELLSRNTPGIAPRVRIALIPYSQSVNAGPLYDGTYVEYDPTKDAKSGGLLQAILDAIFGRLNALLLQLGLKEIGPVTDGLNRPIGLAALNIAKPKNQTLKEALNNARDGKDNCTTERKIMNPNDPKKFQIDLSEDSPDTAMVNRDRRLSGKGACPSVAVVPLTTNAGTLTTAIGNFTAGGGTAGQIGIQWTRYLLSPKWGNFLDGRAKGSKPAPYGGNVKKIAILMTDGEFNTAYATSDGGAMTGAVTNQPAASSGHAKTLCTAMKSEGIEVFTIGFMLGSGTGTLQACASPDDNGVTHFYNASSGDELKAAFDEITQNLEVLRLTQ